MGLFLEKSKGYSLTIRPKKRIPKIGLFLEKSKGYSLTIRPKKRIPKMGLFLEKAKAIIALQLGQKTGFQKWAYF